MPLAAAAHLVETRCREGPDQREARRQREQEGQGIVLEDDFPQDETDDGVEGDDEHDVAGHRHEIVSALGERLTKIRDADLAHVRPVRDPRGRTRSRERYGPHGELSSSRSARPTRRGIRVPHGETGSVIARRSGCASARNWKS